MVQFREGIENDKWYWVLAWISKFANIKICVCKKIEAPFENCSATYI